MNAERTGVWTAVSLIFIGCLVALAAQPASAQAVIPEGSIITSAEFTIYARYNVDDQTVYLYRITQEWTELGVTWNSFSGSYDSFPPISPFMAATQNVVDVTDLVQGWVDGDYPNYGIFLEMGNLDHIAYYSSEDGTVATRPRLEVEYTDPFGVPGNHVVIQRPAETQGGVADTYIWESRSGANFGNSPSLYTGMYYGRGEKQSLVRFFFTVEPSPPGPGTGTQGYWKNHPRAWPVSGIEIGGMWYTKRDAIRGMNKPVKGDKTRSMFRQLVAAKLNVEIGNNDSCIDLEIEAADSWMCDHPPGSRVKANSPAWQNEGGFLHYMLNEYNNGRLDCANHRDD